MGGLFGWLALAVLAGGVLSVQAGINTLLSRELGGPLQGTLASFLTGSVVLLAAWGIKRSPWPGIDRMGQVPLVTWSGGLLGALYVGITILLSPRLGAATFFGVVVGGQMATALVLDHFGALGFAVHPITALRVVGIALVVSGVVLIRAS
ncbi:MAG TPA: DMT family transporter [Polyangiaceae bacterium]|nr:DMT family transporter [Polyangiaceae bacterium]